MPIDLIAEDRITIWTYKVYLKNSVNPLFIQSRFYADEIRIRLDADFVYIVDSHISNKTRRKDK